MSLLFCWKEWMMRGRSSGRSTGKWGTNTESIRYPHTQKSPGVKSRERVGHDINFWSNCTIHRDRPIDIIVALNCAFHRRMELAHGVYFSTFVLKYRCTLMTDWCEWNSSTEKFSPRLSPSFITAALSRYKAQTLLRDKTKQNKILKFSI